MAVVPGGGDQGEGAAALLAQFGQELGASDEDRAGQAGVGVRAPPLDRDAAVPVGQHLRGDAVPGLRPLGLGERPPGSMVTRSPLMLTRVACSQRRRTVWSVIFA